MSKLFVVHVDGNRRFDDVEIPEGVETVGQWADQVAREHIGSSDVADREFSFKADGEVADRDAKVSKLGDGALLELVEVTVLDETTADAVVEEKPARRRSRAKADDSADGDGDKTTADADAGE
jgi:hypothetical protein